MRDYFITDTTHTMKSNSDFVLKVRRCNLEDEIWLFIENEPFRMEYEEAKQLGELLIELSNIDDKSK